MDLVIHWVKLSLAEQSLLFPPPMADLAQSLPMHLPVLIKECSMQPYTPILIYIIYSWIPYSKQHLHYRSKVSHMRTLQILKL